MKFCRNLKRSFEYVIVFGKNALLIGGAILSDMMVDWMALRFAKSNYETG